MEAGVLPAASQGYNVIALENPGLDSEWGACGSFSGPGGAWKQLYTGAHTDNRYAEAVPLSTGLPELWRRSMQ
jgi:hypothetical protein